jgi:hypothetical protein
MNTIGVDERLLVDPTPRPSWCRRRRCPEPRSSPAPVRVGGASAARQEALQQRSPLVGMSGRAPELVAFGADVAAELPVADRLGEVRQPVGATPHGPDLFLRTHMGIYTLVCATVARQKSEGPRVTDTTSPERSVCDLAGLAQQLRTIRLELAAIHEQLEARLITLTALTALLGADERPQLVKL